jgi:hypothetical protein
MIAPNSHRFLRLTALFALLILTAFLGMAPLAQAQSPVNVGPLVATNIARLTTDSKDVNSEFFFGFGAGGFARINIKKLYLQPEALIALKGSNFTISNFQTQGSAQTTTADVKYRFTNADIPLMVGYKLLDVKLVNLRVMGGPVASFNLGNRTTSDVETFRDINNKIRSAQWGYAIGVGADVASLTVDLRYEGSFNTISENVPGLLRDPRNQIFRISVGWKFL